MLHWRRQPLFSCLLAAALCGESVIGGASMFENCKPRVERIMNGTEIFGSITNETIGTCIYNGPINGLGVGDGQISRADIIALTTEGMLQNPCLA